MSSLFNRLKNLKTGSINFNNNEGDTGSLHSFDEEGFLCPNCHRKFQDTYSLEHHYMQAHTQSDSPTASQDTNGIRKHEDIEDPMQEVSIWKQQFVVSEENRMQLSSELMQQKQRVGDLEEELESLQKQLRSAQTKVIEQSQEIGNLKATKDVYDAQIAMFTDELLSTQGELKEKQNQVNTLCNDLIPRPTNDDVDVLKRELISVQQRMNEMSLEKEQQIDIQRQILSQIHHDTKQLDRYENQFYHNTSILEDILTNYTSEIDSIKQNLCRTHQYKNHLDQTIHSMRNNLVEKQKEIDELKQINIDLEQRLINKLQNEQKQTDHYRIENENLKSIYDELEKQFEEIKQEKNQLFMNQIEGDQDNERQNLVRQLTQEKEHFEQQIKEFKKQIKQLTEENYQSNSEIILLKQQLDEITKEKEKQLNEMSNIHEEYRIHHKQLENNLRQTHKEEFEKLENELNQRIQQLENEVLQLKQTIQEQQGLAYQLDTIQNDKLNLENRQQISQQTIESLQSNISQLNTQLDEKNQSLQRLSTSIHHSIEFVHKIHQFIQENIFTSQTNLFILLEQSEQELQSLRTQTFENIRQELTNYLTVIHEIILNNKTKLEKQIEEDQLKFVEEQENALKQYNQLKTDYEHLIEKSKDEKQKYEIQLEEINQNLVQVSESLSQTAEQEREKYEKQISSLKDELTSNQSDFESRTKKFEMQLSALRENLSTVRSELKNAQEKVIQFEELNNENQDLQKRFDLLQDEQNTLIQRSITNENRNEKLLLENGQLAKKNSDLESALHELAREYQGLQIQTNRVSERRWVNDQDIHQCMKCNQIFTLTQRKHHCRSCGNVFCDNCSSKTAIIAATSKKPQRVCDQCYKELTS